MGTRGNTQVAELPLNFQYVWVNRCLTVPEHVINSSEERIRHSTWLGHWERTNPKEQTACFQGPLACSCLIDFITDNNYAAMIPD